MKITIDDHTIDLIPTGKSYRAMIGDKTFDVEILQSREGKLDLLIDGERVMAYVSMDQSKRWVTINGQTVVLTKQSDSRKSRSGHHHSASDLTAPMPGQVRAVSVSEGEAVVKGQTLVVLEAMKMEIRIQALTDGIVKKLFVKQGQTVDREQVLIEIE
jgi:acetyl/propionyl-CoA carboxylase alpha subunit